MAKEVVLRQLDLPLAGLRVGVLHLQFLLPGASLLRENVPKESAAGTAAASQPAIPGKLGSPAGSPRLPTGLPGNAAGSEA